MAFVIGYVRSFSTRTGKWPRSLSRGKRQRSPVELQAMEELKKKVSEEQGGECTDYAAVLVDCFRGYDVVPNASAYSFVIKYLFKRGLLSQLPPVLECLEKAEFDKPERIFVNVIRSYGRIEKVQDAVDMFFRMPEFDCAPSVVSLNALLSVLCRKDDGLVLVKDVILQAWQMNIRLEESTFRILIEALCRKCKFDCAIELMNMMPHFDCTPDARFYSLILSSLCRVSYAGQIIGFLDEMRNAGLVPNVEEYKKVIGVLVKEARTQDACSILNRMRSDGKWPDILIYNTVLDGVVLANDFQKVEELFDEMLLLGVVPNIATYNSYITSLCKQKKFEEACRMASCMEKAGCNPTIETFNIIMAGFVEVGEISKLREIMSEVQGKGLKFNSRTCDIVINGLLIEGQVLNACELLMDMLNIGLSPGSSTFSALLCTLNTKGLLEGAEIRELI